MEIRLVKSIVLRFCAKKQLLLQTRSSRVRDLKSIVTYTSLSKKLIFLPVYRCVYTFENKSFQIFVQAQSGQIVGARPYGLGVVGEAGKQGLDSFSEFISQQFRNSQK